MVDLASVEDVQEISGRALTPEEETRLVPILAKLSGLFRREARQTFTPASSTVRLRVTDGNVYLPQLPVVEVDTVRNDHGVDLDYARDGQWLRRVAGRFVRVSYSHGSTDVPDLVRVTIADAARQIIGVDSDAAAGVSQSGTTAGPYSNQKTYAAWAQGGSTRLSPEDVAIARGYRVTLPKVWSARPGMWPGGERL